MTFRRKAVTGDWHLGDLATCRWAIPFRLRFEEIAENDFNLSIPRYVDTFDEEEEIDVAAVEREIERLEAELVEVRGRMKQDLAELGV